VITVPLDEDHEQDACSERLADDAGVLGVALVLDDQSQRTKKTVAASSKVTPCFRA
jgi:hypothetical protein